TFHTNLNTAHTTVAPQTPHPPEPHPVLPTTPWQHTHHWITTTPALEHPGRNGVAVNPTGIGNTELGRWSYRLEWPVLPLPSGPRAAIARSGSWLVVSDQGLSDELARVADPGSRVEFLAPPALDDDATRLHGLLDGVDNVLYAPPVAAGPVDVESAYHMFHAARRLAAAMITSDSKPKLIVLTRNAQPVTEGERANPAHAVLWGLGRTLALEHPEIWGGVIDLDESIPTELAARYVLDEAAGLNKEGGEDQVVYRSGVRRAPRLERRTAPAASVTLSENTSQLVIGATGNIGPHLIRQLVQMGAKTIVTVSRNPGTRLAELAESLDATGTNLIPVAADATDPAAMTALFDRFGVDLPPLEGIYLAAFAGQPVLLVDMTDDDVAAMFRPKLDAARLLHRLSLKQPVKHFVSFSSISGLIGSRWLAHYTATSAFLDTLGYARRLMGLPATVVAWGLWKSLADAQQGASQVSAESGLQPMADEVAIGALPLAMSPDAGVHSVVVAADWPLLAAAYRTRGALPIVDDLLPAPEGVTMPESEFRKALRTCQAARRHDMLFDHIGALAAKVMGMPPTETLDPSAGFFQLGMDSLMSVTLQRVLSDSLGEFLPASVVFDYPTVYSLTDYLATILPELLETCQQPTADTYGEFTEADFVGTTFGKTKRNAMTAATPDRRAIITEALHKIDDLTARPEIAEKSSTEPIAVIGMGCRFPGGVDTPDQFWEMLCAGRNGIVRVPADRWDADAYYTDDHTVPGTICSREGGFLTSWQPDEFDAEFFSISPREAAAMDPQQRLLIEVAWEALEDAGIAPHTIRGTQTSVFVGVTAYDYMLTLAGRLRPEDLDAYIPTGNSANFAAGRLAYILGARGPAVVLDTACSSSLVAIHLACQSLRGRESDMAVVGGTNLLLSPGPSIACSRWGMLSPEGQCKTFDVSADGYVRGEGAGVVVLKRLDDAMRDGNRVLAVVRGTAVNQDGASSGVTVPNGPAQQALLRTALTSSKLKPADIDYIEAHGTGTPLGDPIELDSLSKVFSDRESSEPLVIGSVKTNVGHLEAAAGVAGFMKAVLAIRNGYIPRHLNFNQLTAHASEAAARLNIAAEGIEWPTTGRPRRAGVSSFGVSGTNAHVVIEQAPDPIAAPVRTPDPAVSTLVVYGKTPQRVATMASALADWMEGPGAQVALADIAHTLNHHRPQQTKFGAVAAIDRGQAVAGLRGLASGQSAPGVVAPHAGSIGPGTVFVYSGRGSQWAGMGRQLLADEPAFAEAI
ncbi:SDR family NAD(P)-dependent oxidoreductase, partial [Mycobacterium sp.]|uniref:SDR family NAD(P)-dependent oxidoreductase n=1 Tax=Mycobacterium sp. TaxID=1785 RepID=UPI003F986BAA